MNIRSAALLFLLAFFAAVQAQTVFNVRDFGAVGDDKHDDTEAIQKAADAASAQLFGGRFHGIRYFGAPELYFPTGRYLVTKTIQIKHLTSIRGDGASFVRLEDPEQDLFAFDTSWELLITGMGFMGGRNHLVLGNVNMDRGMVSIRDCKFYNSAAVAVFTRKNSNSTYLQVSHSIFTDCDQALVSNCDKTVIRDCWISSYREMKNKAVIVNMHGAMQIEGLLGVPLCRQPGQRWIDNYGIALHCNNCRFGAEGGGFTPIYNFAKYSNIDCGATAGAVITITQSEVNAQSNDIAKCAVYCIEIPNSIVIRDTALLGVPPVKIISSLKQDGYFDEAQPGCLKFSVEGTGIQLQLPELLQNPRPLGKKSIPTQLTDEETSQRLSEISKGLPDAPAEALPDVWAKPEYWSLDAFMDATTDKNSEYLAMAFKAGRTILLKRTSDSAWPHVEVHFPEIDLDANPILHFRMDNPGGTEFDLVIKAYEENLGVSATLTPRTDATFFPEKEQFLDMRKFGFHGKCSPVLKIYYIGQIYVQPPGVGVKYQWQRCKPGSYWVIDRCAFVPPQE